MAGTRPCTTICHATKTSWSWKRATLWMWWRSATTAGLSVRGNEWCPSCVGSQHFWKSKSFLSSIWGKSVFYLTIWKANVDLYINRGNMKGPVVQNSLHKHFLSWQSFCKHVPTQTTRGHCEHRHTLCITSAILPADTVHNRMTFISICLQFKCYVSFFPSSAGLVFSSWLWFTCGHELLPKCIMGYTRLFVFYPSLSWRDVPEEQAVWNLSRELCEAAIMTTWVPKAPPPLLVTCSAPPPRSAPAGSAFTSRKCRTPISLPVWPRTDGTISSN